MKTQATLLSTALLLAAVSTPAQVVISEINITPQTASDTQWIELVNLGTTKVDLSAWSLYVATGSPGMPGNYWFGFPTGVEINSGAFLRVHWRAFQTPSVTPTDVYTGTSVFNFLFGYGSEPLQKGAGAIGLIASQANLDMNNPALVRDWVSWGVSGLPRESVAIQGGKWIAGQVVPAPSQDPNNKDSLAINYAASGEPTQASAFYRCSRPTPGAHNHTPAAVETYGSSCNRGAVNAQQLGAQSIPAVGNRDFALRITNTTANQTLALLMSPFQGNGTVEFAGCPLWIGLQTAPITVVIPAQAVTTNIPLPIPATVSFGTVYLQAFATLGGSQFDYGFTNGLSLTLSF